MKLSKSQKIWIGIVTFMPIFCLIGYFIAFFLIFFTTLNDPENFDSQVPPENLFVGLGFAMIFIILAMISGIASFIIHLIHVTKNEKLKKQNNGQLIWILVIVLANGIGGIIYYFVEVLPEPKEPITSPQQLD